MGANDTIREGNLLNYSPKILKLHNDYSIFYTSLLGNSLKNIKIISKSISNKHLQIKIIFSIFAQMLTFYQIQ